ncbi:MAG: hypothetical protein ISS41_08885 [Candidatus Aminicenantes bacterium]|nr:hypothetical protein [Candidatus Aminicenantes bacterium]
MSTEKDRVKITEIAEKYTKRGKLQDAISEYQKLLTGDPHDVSVRNIISDLFLKLNEKDKAIEELHKIAGYYEERGLYSQSIAIYKKIHKLNPENLQSAIKLAGLYYNQGFLSEAKAEYLKVAESYKKDNLLKESISVYEKLLKLDRKDIKSTLSLAELYTKEGLVDQAVERYNDVVELKIRSNALKEAGEILNKAKELKNDHLRTLTNFIILLKRENKKKEAFNLITDILKKEKDNVRALTLMGNFHFDDKDFKNAEEVFSKIMSLRPNDVEARVKLGRINIYQDNLDKAFELYEPLVGTLIKKNKVEKAIGLFGLILSSKKVHLPTLEGLASIYKSNNKKKNLEIVYRVLLEEYYKKNLPKESLSVLKELIKICPEDKELKKEYDLLGGEPVLPEEAEEVKVPPEKEKEAEIAPEEKRKAEEEAAKKPEEEAKLNAEEEARKNAEEEERKNAEEEERIKAEAEAKKRAEQEAKLKAEEEARRKTEEEKKVEKAPEEEKEVKKPAAPSEEVDEMLEKNLSQANLYIEQGLIRNARRILENLRISFPYDLRIEERIEAISKTTTQVGEDEILRRLDQVSEKESELFKKESPSPEKEKEKDAIDKTPAESVQKSIKGMEEDIDEEDYESHFNLGFSFLEEGSIDKAIDEFKLASKDKNRSLECYNMISKCYQQKEDFKEAANWVEKALKLSEEGTDKFLALTYELALLYEKLEEMEKALIFYEDIKEWNSGYRDVKKKIKILKKSLRK